MVFNASKGAWSQRLPLVCDEFVGDRFKCLVSLGVGCYALARRVVSKPHLGVQVFRVVARLARFQCL